MPLTAGDRQAGAQRIVGVAALQHAREDGWHVRRLSRTAPSRPRAAARRSARPRPSTGRRIASMPAAVVPEPDDLEHRSPSPASRRCCRRWSCSISCTHRRQRLRRHRGDLGPRTAPSRPRLPADRDAALSEQVGEHARRRRAPGRRRDIGDRRGRPSVVHQQRVDRAGLDDADVVVPRRREALVVVAAAVADHAARSLRVTPAATTASASASSRVTLIGGYVCAATSATSRSTAAGRHRPRGTGRRRPHPSAPTSPTASVVNV